MNKFFKTFLAAAVTALTFVSGASAVSAAVEQPPTDEYGSYLVSNADQLDWISMTFNSGSDSVMMVKLTDDIVYNETLNTSDRTQNRNWTPIGYNKMNFYGVIDGQGHKITGLYCGGQKCAALVAYNHGSIRNLGIEDSYFISSLVDDTAYTGAFAALHKEGRIENCYVVNTYLIGPYVVGGIAGMIGANNGSSAIMNSCYAARCRYTQSKKNWDYVDALAYPEGSRSVTNCYWGLPNNARVTSSVVTDTYKFTEDTATNVGPLTTGELCYKLNGSMNPTSDNPSVWRQNLNLGDVKDEYPVLNTSHYSVYLDDTIYTNRQDDPSIYNSGTDENLGDVATNEEGYYEIYSREHLFQFAEIVNSDPTKKDAKAKLMKDIDVNTVKIEEAGSYQPWVPIGNINAPYKGEFDGQGYAINGLYVASADEEYESGGLFGCIDGAVVKNIKLVNSYIYAGSKNANGRRVYAGPIVANAKSGTISNCMCRDNTVISEESAGGVVGLLSGNTVCRNCYCIRCSVKGDRNYSNGYVVGTMSSSTAPSGCLYYLTWGSTVKTYSGVKELPHGDIDLSGEANIVDAIRIMLYYGYYDENDIIYYAADYDENSIIEEYDVEKLIADISGLEYY